MTDVHDDLAAVTDELVHWSRGVDSEQLRITLTRRIPQKRFGHLLQALAAAGRVELWRRPTQTICYPQPVSPVGEVLKHLSRSLTGTTAAMAAEGSGKSTTWATVVLRGLQIAGLARLSESSPEPTWRIDYPQQGNRLISALHEYRGATTVELSGQLPMPNRHIREGLAGLAIAGLAEPRRIPHSAERRWYPTSPPSDGESTNRAAEILAALASEPLNIADLLTRLDSSRADITEILEFLSAMDVVQHSSRNARWWELGPAAPFMVNGLDNPHNQPTPKAVYDFVASHPSGVLRSEVVAATGIADTEVQYCLAALFRSGDLVNVMDNGEELWLTVEAADDSSPALWPVLEYLIRQPAGASVQELAAQTGQAEDEVSQQLKQLHAVGAATTRISPKWWFRPPAKRPE